jgi:hypothetical protein
MAAMPQSGSVHHGFSRKPRCARSKIQLSPPAVSWVPEFISQRQTTPEATNDTAIGNRYTVRKKPSPRTPRSSRNAQSRPSTIVPTMNTTVKMSRFFRECRNLSLMSLVNRLR